MTYWFRQHRYALSVALVHLRRAPGSFLFNILVVAIALALPFMGATLLDNVRPMSEQLSVDPELSIFLKLDTPRQQAEELAVLLRQTVPDKQAKIIFTEREKALDTLKQKSGLADVLTTLGENPLPDSYVLKLDAFRQRHGIGAGAAGRAAAHHLVRRAARWQASAPGQGRRLPASDGGG